MEESPPRRSKLTHQQKTTAKRESPQPPPTESTPMREPPQLCVQHREQIHFCCFDCDAVVCCARCLTVGRHRSHDIKNLHRSYVLVEANLNEMMIKLAAKVDLYSLSHEKLSVGRSEMIEDYAEARIRVQKEFKRVQDMLQQRLIEITSNIEQQCKAKEDEMNGILTTVREQIKLCMDYHAQVSDSIQLMGEVELCKFYSEAKQQVAQLLSSTPIQQKLSPQRSQISLQFDRLQQLIEAVRQLKVPCISISQRKRTAHVRASVDLQKGLNHNNLLQRNARDSHPLSPAQPAQSPEPQGRPKSRQLLLALCCSRRSPKMFSMPSSPPNEKQSPLHQYLQIQKKSFNLGRKHC